MITIVLPRFSTILVTAAAIFFCMVGGPTNAAAQDGFVNPDFSLAVSDFVVQPDGKIVVGGGFATAGGQPRSKLARLNRDGTLDTSFPDPQVVGPDQFSGGVSSIALQPDGKIVIGGSFVSVRGETRNHLARLNADGTLDPSFVPSVSDWLTAVALQSDGKILIAGSFSTVNGQSRNRMARLNSDGTLDTSFIDPLITSVSGYPIGTIYVQPDGKILIGGFFNSVGGVARSFATRLEPNGSPDWSFNLSVSGPVEEFEVQPDGMILICGYISSVNGETRRGIARIKSDGELDGSFIDTAIPSGNVTAMALQGDGRIVVGGEFANISGVARDDLARLNSNGTFDTTFQDVNVNFGGTFFSINGILVQPDGKVLVGGQFNMVGRQPRKNMVRLLPNGLLDLAPAQPLTVTKTADTNDGACDADCSLREAIAAENANPNGNGSSITFDPAVFSTPQTITLTLGELFIDWDHRVSINGPGSGLLTISGNNANRILRVTRDVIASISGVTLSNGLANEGGAIYVEFNGVVTSVTITNSVFSNNAAAGGSALRSAGSASVSISNTTFSGNNAFGGPGGGGTVVFNTGTLAMTNCTISNNQSSGTFGGGIHSTNAAFTLTGSTVTGNQGNGIFAGGTATITNTTITDNQSANFGAGLYSGGNVSVINSTIIGNTVTTTDGQGGGIVNYGTLTVTGSLIAGNVAAFGAGIFTAGNLTMTSTSLLGNTANDNGGGLYNNIGGAAPVSVTNCTISGNFGGRFAGGVYNRARMNIDRSTVSDNIANLGGGGFFNVFQANVPAILSLTRSTVSGNKSNAGGGAFQNQNGTIDLTNSTVSSNDAGGGGGAFTITQDGIVNLSFATIAFNVANLTGGIRIASGTVNANNSIIARNKGRTVGADFFGQLNSQGYNIIGDAMDTTVVGDTTGNQLNTDPRLHPMLRNNGGATFTHALLANSPALDAGKSPAAMTIDQREYPRPVDFPSIANAPAGNGADVGSFEYQPGEAPRFVPTFDLDGDGKTDVAVFRPSNGTWYVRKSQTGTAEQLQFGANGDVPLDVDLDGDLKADYAVWRPSTGEWFWKLSSDSSFGGAVWGIGGDRPVPADYDGDGKTDLAVWRPSNGLNYIVKSGGGFLGVQWGGAGDIPSNADLNGDGKTDFVVFRPSNGTWYTLINGTSTTSTLQFGQSGDVPVRMDVDGDLRGDIAVWRPSTGEWFYRRSSNLTFGGLQWGANGDRPVPGDYDGDGRTDFAAWRSTDGIHYIVRNSGGFIGVAWGGAGDIPVLASPVP